MKSNRRRKQPLLEAIIDYWQSKQSGSFRGSFNEQHYLNVLKARIEIIKN